MLRARVRLSDLLDWSWTKQLRLMGRGESLAVVKSRRTFL